MHLEKYNTNTQRYKDTKSEDEISHQIIEASMEVLPGFLGLPQDWGFSFSHPLKVHEYCNSGGSMPDFWTWAKRFNQQIHSPSILMGYSLGARLGMHALVAAPDRWQRAIFISGHPGLAQEEEKSLRWQKDCRWAQRFAEEPWATVMRDWNDQQVFGTRPSPFHREEADYSRQMLTSILRDWSLAKQEDLRPRLQQLDIPILWIVAEEDEKFLNIAKTLSWRHPLSQVWIAPQSGHRVPWDQPLLFKQQVEYFLKSPGETS